MCDWPSRVIQIRPECREQARLGRVEGVKRKVRRGEIMRHFTGDIRLSKKIRDGPIDNSIRVDFRGKPIRDNEVHKNTILVWQHSRSGV